MQLWKAVVCCNLAVIEIMPRFSGYSSCYRCGMEQTGLNRQKPRGMMHVEKTIWFQANGELQGDHAVIWQI